MNDSLFDIERNAELIVYFECQHGAVGQREIGEFAVGARLCVGEEGVAVFAGSLATFHPCQTLVERHHPAAVVDTEGRCDGVLSILAVGSVFAIAAGCAVSSVIAVGAIFAIGTIFAIGSIYAIYTVGTQLVAVAVKDKISVDGPIPVAIGILTYRNHRRLAILAGCTVGAVFAIGTRCAVSTVDTVFAVCDFHCRFLAGGIDEVDYTDAVAFVFNALNEEFACHEVGESLYIAVELLNSHLELPYAVVEVVHGVPELRVVVLATER